MPARSHQYEWFSFVVEEDGESGLEQIPVAGGPYDPSEIVRWSSGWATRTVHWFAAAWQEPPAVPRSRPRSPNLVLLRKKIKPVVTIPVPGKGRFHIVEGVYTYALRRPPTQDGPIALGDVPQEIGDSLGQRVQRR